MSPQTTQLVFIFAMVAVFYLLVLRPQQKRMAEQRAMISAIKVGDEIVTVGGIFGTVIATGERLRIRVADGSEFELAPQAVGSLVASKDDAPPVDAVDAAHAEDASDTGAEPGDGTA